MKKVKIVPVRQVSPVGCGPGALAMVLRAYGYHGAGQKVDEGVVSASSPVKDSAKDPAKDPADKDSVRPPEDPLQTEISKVALGADGSSCVKLARYVRSINGPLEFEAKVFAGFPPDKMKEGDDLTLSFTDLDLLLRFLREGPVIVSVSSHVLNWRIPKKKPDGHLIVVTKVAMGDLFYFDPATGSERSIGTERFKLAWYSRCMVAQGHMLIVRPKKKAE